MTLREKLLYLNSSEGPHIPQRALAIYCGIGQPQLNRFMKYGKGLGIATQRQIEKGLQEMAREIYFTIFDRN